MSSLNGEVILADQSIGDALQLRIFGDEFYARRETLDGYTVIYDTEQRRYCYATLAVGRFVSAGIPVYKPAPRNLRRHLKEDPDVRNEKFGLRYARIRPPEEDAETALMRTLGADGGLLNGRKLHRGQIQGLTVMVDFDDVRTNIAIADVEAMFNSDDYSENGNYCSVKTYFETVSSGKLTYTNFVIGPVRLSKRRSHYINNLLFEEAMDVVVNDLNVDLTQFDSKNEGIVDAINFLYAGESQYDGRLWPHNSFKALHYGSMRTHYYQLTGLGLHKVDLRIGTICHENGHLLCRFLVLLPFDAPLNRLRDAISRSIREENAEPVFLDKIAAGAAWVDEISRRIRTSDAVIADVSRPTPNAMFELGVAQGLGKPLILLLSEEANVSLPSDLVGYQNLTYSPNNLSSFSDRLRRAARQLEARRGAV